MYLLREENGLSLQQVGDELGKRDHSTVRYGAERIVAEFKTNDALRMEISETTRKDLYAAAVARVTFRS